MVWGCCGILYFCLDGCMDCTGSREKITPILFQRYFIQGIASAGVKG
jgi:hypothetical protein